jgi:ribonuclease Z
MKKTGKELGELRKKGEAIEEEFWDPFFVFMGDTSIAVYERNPMLFDYPTIITECTFIPDPSEDQEEILARCHRDGHIHWTQLEPYVRSHSKTNFVLMHFSLRYGGANNYFFA